MTARLFGFDAPLTTLLNAIDNGMRWLLFGNDLARLPARAMAHARRRDAGGRRLAYLDDRMLHDIGLRRDDFPSAVRERQQDQVMRFHI